MDSHLDFIIIIIIAIKMLQLIMLDTVRVRDYFYYIMPTCFSELPYITTVITGSSVRTSAVSSTATITIAVAS